MSWRDDDDERETMASGDEMAPSALTADFYDDPAEVPASVIEPQRWQDNAETVALVSRLANSALAVALRASGRFVTIERTMARMAEQLSDIADRIQSMPTRDDHDAIVADVTQLQNDLRALHLRKSA